MEAAGLVRREVPPGDRRSIAVVLTDAGRERFATVRAFHREGIRRHFSDRLSAREAEQLMAILGRLRNGAAGAG
jgi:DNA-binding MarR family transcriptional regulator